MPKFSKKRQLDAVKKAAKAVENELGAQEITSKPRIAFNEDPTERKISREIYNEDIMSRSQTRAGVRSTVFYTLGTILQNVAAFAQTENERNVLQELYTSYNDRYVNMYRRLNKNKIFFKAIRGQFRELGACRISIKMGYELIVNETVEKFNHRNLAYESDYKNQLIIKTESQLEDVIKNGLADVIRNILADIASQYTVDGDFRITSITINLFPIMKVSGASYFEHPFVKKHNRILYSPRNSDSMCFLYAIIFSLCFDNDLVITPSERGDLSKANRFNGIIAQVLTRFREWFLKTRGKEFDDSMLTYPVDIFNDTESLIKFQEENGIALTIHRLNDVEDGYAIDNIYLNTHEQLRDRAYILLTQKDELTHFVAIKNITNLLKVFFENNKHETNYCEKCLQFKKDDHICLNVTEIKSVQPYYYVPYKPSNWGYKESYDNKEKVVVPTFASNTLKNRYIAVFDFEAINKKIVKDVQSLDENGELQTTSKILNEQYAAEYSILLLDTYDKVVLFEKYYCGEQCLYDFQQTLKEISIMFKELINEKNQHKLHMSSDDDYQFILADKCYICNRKFSAGCTKVRHHDHMKACNNFLGAAHQGCNLQAKAQTKLPIFAHNFTGYDAHIVTQSLDFYDWNKDSDDLAKIDTIMTSSNKFKMLAFDVFQFRDSAAHCQGSLAKLVDNLKKSKGQFYFTRALAHQRKPEMSEEDFQKYFTSKIVFPYEKMTDFGVYNRTKVFERKDFASVLDDNKTISEKEYQLYLDIHKEFGFKTHREYCELYNMLDTYLLADIIVNYRDILYENFKIDPLGLNTLPAFSEAAAIRESDVKIPLLINEEMFNDAERLKRGGMSFSIERACEPENEYTSWKKRCTHYQNDNHDTFLECVEIDERGDYAVPRMFSYECEGLKLGPYELRKVKYGGRYSDFEEMKNEYLKVNENNSISKMLNTSKTHVQYYDLNQMYSSKMLECLPHDNFKYMDKADIEYINTYKKNYEISKDYMYRLGLKSNIISYEKAKEIKYKSIYHNDEKDDGRYVSKNSYKLIDFINDGFIPRDIIFDLINRNKTQKYDEENFEFIPFEEEDTGLKCNENACILVVDLIPPKDELTQMRLQNFMLCPENKVIKSEFCDDKTTKLTSDFEDKIEYNIYYSNLLFYMSMGYQVRRIHKVLYFTERNFLASFVSKAITLRKKAKKIDDKFGVSMFKLVVNALYGKTMQNVRGYEEFKFCRYMDTCIEGEESKKLRINNNLVKQYNNPYFKDVYFASEKYVIVNSHQRSVELNKPIHIGACVLEKSKMLIYKFYYQYFKKAFGCRMKLLATDTDSMILKFTTSNLINDLSKIKEHLEFHESNPLYIKENENEFYKMKDELETDLEAPCEVTSFYSNAAKSYMMQYIDKTKFPAVKNEKEFCEAYLNLVESNNPKFKRALKGVKKDISKFFLQEDKNNIVDLKTAFKNSVYENKTYYATMVNIRAYEHKIYLEQVEKIAVSWEDHKRNLIPVTQSLDGILSHHFIETRPWFYGLTTDRDLLNKYTHRELPMREFNYVPKSANIPNLGNSFILKDREQLDQDGDTFVKKGLDFNPENVFFGRSEEKTKKLDADRGLVEEEINKYYAYSWKEINDEKPSEIRHEIIRSDSRKIIIDIDLKGFYPQVETVVKDGMYNAFVSLFLPCNIKSALKSQMMTGDVGFAKNMMDFALAYEQGFKEHKKMFLDNIITFSACGMTLDGYKTSFHFVIDNMYAQRAEDCRIYVEAVQRAIIEVTGNRLFANAIDLGIYRKNQSIRVYGACKVGTDRYKRCDREISFKKSLVSYTRDCFMLPQLVDIVKIVKNRKYEEKQKKFKEAAIQSGKTVIGPLDVIAKLQDIDFIKKNFIIDGVNEKGFYKFKRAHNNSYECDCCKRRHDNPNQVWLWAIYNDNNKKITVGCRRDATKNGSFKISV